MCDNDRSCPTTTELGPSSEFFSFSSPCRSSSSLRSRAGHSRLREFGRGSEVQALDARSWRMPFATAERIYRCLGGGRPARAGDVQNVGASIVFYERWRETQDAQLLQDIADYNRDDVESTQQLHDWLLKTGKVDMEN